MIINLGDSSPEVEHDDNTQVQAEPESETEHEAAIAYVAEHIEDVCYEIDEHGTRHEVDMFGFSSRDSKYINSAHHDCEMETDGSSSDPPAIPALDCGTVRLSSWTRSC